jgi:oxysterol-binding protein-related protein 8
MAVSLLLLSTCIFCGEQICHPEYVITMPNMYARGILFGKMVLELGDTCIAKNEKNGFQCDLEFKTKVGLVDILFCNAHMVQLVGKGFFSGTYNSLVGRVRNKESDIGEISGRWSHVMEFKPKVRDIFLLSLLFPSLRSFL